MSSSLIILAISDILVVMTILYVFADELQLLSIIAICMLLVGVVVFYLMTAGGWTSPYGRYTDKMPKFLGPEMSPQLAWCLQETPSVVAAIISFIIADRNKLSRAHIVLLSYYWLHYTLRSFVYPFRLKGGKPTRFGIFLCAFAFCSINGYLQSRSLTLNTNWYTDDWFTDIRFIIGTIIFFGGMFINWQSDTILQNLRPAGSKEYFIPYGGAFRYVSAANFFGEIVEWIGFAIACWSLPAMAFAIFTFANTAPRGFQHHQFYLRTFKDKYPKERRALIPFIY